MKRIFLILILSLLTVAAFSQGNNALNISILGSGNYSAKLSDYYSPKNVGMLTVIVRNTDFKEPNLQIQLYMSVTNGLKTYIQTKSPNISKTFQIGSGETLTLTGQDLECIFNTYYLNYNKSNFQDGQNILKIYARDTRTGKIVSNTAQILLKSVMIAPPKLTRPDDNLTIETDNQFVNFTWRGDNGGANIATRCNYRYKFELWKQNINDKNIEAQRFADFTADNLFDEKYQFLLSTFPFEIGQKYCWRVTAYDPLEKATFLQNGKSEVRSFIYKHLPVPVTGLKHTINERNRQATVTWNAEEGHTKYYVEYYNPQTTKTIAMESDVPQFTTANAPKQEYKIFFRVKAQCWGDDSRCSDWTDWDTVKFAAPQIVKPKYPCGYQFPKVEITNFELKTDFKEGDTVSEANGSSDYEIINCKSDGDGVLQGQFYLIMNAWGGAKIACEFWDTKINTDNQIITTRYRSIDTPVGMIEPEELANYVKSLWLDGNSLATSSKIRDTIVIDQKFDYLYRRENGEFVAVVVNDDGSTTETEFNLHKNPSQTLITDGKGDSLVYSQNGHVMGIKEYRATGGNAALLKDYHRRSDSLAQWQINFLPYSEQTYAFDYLGSGNHGIYSSTEYYPSVNGYDFRYKSVECYKSDKVIVDFGSYLEKDSVIFKDKYGVTLKLSKGNILNFTGVAKPDTNYIYAYRGDEKIGKLSVNTYRQKTYKVVLVSVNGAKLPEANDLENYLNEVYKQSVVSFEISTDELTLNDLTSFSHGGSGVLTVYNVDQKTVLRAYDPQMQDGVYYLFFIDNVTDKKDGNGTPVSGYMPRGYNAGFIYDGGSEHTIAHELGHGIAGLEHVFENSKSSGKTQNLMDYASGEELWHFQWDAIQDPSRVWMKWNKDESEGENQFLEDPICLQKFIEAFRRAYAYSESLEYPADGWPGFGHRASNIKLLDGFVYSHIEKNVLINYAFSPRSTNYTKTEFSSGITYTYGCKDNWIPKCSGNILRFSTNDKIESFEKYMFVDKNVYNSQIQSLISKIYNTSEREKIVEFLSILPYQEYSGLKSDEKMRILKLILSKEKKTVLIDCNCADELSVFINILNSLSEQELTQFLDVVFWYDNFSRFRTYIQNEVYSDVIRILCDAYVKVYYKQLQRGYFTSRERNLPDWAVRAEFYEFNDANNKLFKFEGNGYYCKDNVFNPNDIVNVFGLEDNVEIAKALNLNQFKKQTGGPQPKMFVSMPAFFLEYLIRKSHQLDETTKTILRTISLNGAFLPIEDVYILFTGSDFDGIESSRLVAGGFVLLDVIQMGRVYKLAKVEIKDVAKGTYHVINRPVLKTITKDILKDASIDISCQFVSNLIKNLAMDAEIKDKLDFDNAVYKAFTDIDPKGALLDASFGNTYDDTKLATSLICVREILSKMQKDGVEWESVKNGGWNCFIELVAAVFQHYALKKGRFPILNTKQEKQVKIAFNMVLNPNSTTYKSVETILKYLPKN